MIRLKVRALKWTSEHSPSQWEGHLEDGRMFYIRFEQLLVVTVSNTPTDNVFDALNGEEIYAAFSPTGYFWDGFSSTYEMQRHTQEVLDWGELLEPEWANWQTSDRAQEEYLKIEDMAYPRDER